MRPLHLSRKFACVKHTCRILLRPLVFAAFFILLLPVTSRAQTHIDTMHCNRSKTIDTLLAYYKGGQATYTVNIYVDYDTTLFRRGDSIRLSYSGDTNDFKMTSGNALHIVSDTPSYLQYVFRYNPTDIVLDTFQILLTKGSCRFSITLGGNGVDTTSDKALISLDVPFQKPVVFLTSKDTTVRHLILYNEQQMPVVIDSIWFLRDSSFRIDPAIKY